MYDERNAQALHTWRSLWERPEIRVTAQEQYEELLKLADEYLKKGIINRDERKVLVTEATKRYAHSVEGIREVT